MSIAQEEGLKHLKDLQIKLEFLESQIYLLRKDVKEKDDKIRYLNDEILKIQNRYYKAIEDIPLIGELVCRELNGLVPKICRLAKRERGAKRDILSKLGLDYEYNKIV